MYDINWILCVWGRGGCGIVWTKRGEGYVVMFRIVSNYLLGVIVCSSLR